MKTKLISALKVAINALETGTVHYNWEKASSCNCGVVSQAVLDLSKQELLKTIAPMHAKFKEDNQDEVNFTWKRAVRNYCSITGKTEFEILNDLFDNGFSPADICHLEYLENPAILQRANLYKVEQTIVKIKTGGTTTTTPIIIKTKIKAKGIRGFFGFTDEVEEVKNESTTIETFKEETSKQKYLEKEYYKNKQNLIKYLKAWVSILEEQEKLVSKQLNKIELNEELLKLVSDEKYEEAAKVRDLIAVS